MGRIHIGKNGPAPCQATVRACRYGGKDNHYETLEEAQVAYAKQQGGVLQAPVSKALPPPAPASSEAPRTYLIREERLQDAKNLLVRLNRRLEKAGIEERFTMDLQKHHREHQEVVGGALLRRRETYYSATVKNPSISYGGHKFLAKMERAGEGFTTKSAPRVELQGWRPQEMLCEHCGQKRGRHKTYLIEGPEGERKQIGSTCVDLYLGVKADGLDYMFMEPLEPREGEEDEWGLENSPSRASLEMPTQDILAVALAVSNEGRTFVPKSSSWGEPTVYALEDVLWGRGGSQEKQAWRDEMVQRAESLKASGRVQELVQAMKDLPEDSDYTANLKNLGESPWAGRTHHGLLASAVLLLRKKDDEKQAKNLAQAGQTFTPGYMGQVKEKLPKGSRWHVVENKVITTQDRYSYRGEMVKKSLMTLRGPQGHRVVWFASKVVEAEPGQELVVSSGTIMKHDFYREQEQTIIGNVRLLGVEDPPEEASGEAREEVPSVPHH